MLWRTSLLFCLLVLVASRSSGMRRGYYTVVAPGSVRTNTPYHVSVSLGDFHRSTWFNISLTSRYGVHVEKTVEVQPGSVQLISMEVPKINYVIGRLSVIGFRGIASRHDAPLIIENHNYQVYLQTDKPRYKPGELVRFRVICIDELTRPAVTDDVLDVLIYDNDNNLVQKMAGIKLTQGVFKGQFQLAEYTLLGQWAIGVMSNGFPMRRKSFLVSRYVLPRFTVEIDTKSDVSVHDDEIKLLIKAKYAHDEPVKGNMSVNFSVKSAAQRSLQQSFSRQVEIDGSHLISLNLEKDLRVNKTVVGGTSMKLLSLVVDARLTDSATKHLIGETAVITVHTSPYKIKVDAPRSYDPEVPVDVKVSITDLQNNPINDKGTPVKIFAKPVSQMTAEASKTIFLDEKGFGVALVDLTNRNFSRYSLSAEFRGYTSLGEEIEMKVDSAFSLNVLTSRPAVGEEIVVQLNSRDPIDHFVYEIVSRGNILQAQRINVPNQATTHQFRIKTTHVMIPKISLYIHRVKRGQLDTALKDILIGRTLQNSIEIDVKREVRPGASVSVNVTTDEGSYVGLMGIDKRLLMDSETDNHFTEGRVYSRLMEYDAQNLNHEVDPGAKAGLVTFTNIIKPTKDSDSDKVFGGVDVVSRFDDQDQDTWGVVDTKPRIRRIFSDGWLFDDFERTPRGGLQLHPTTPDSITTWEITGFSLNPTTGLSLTKDPATLRVFQTFFVSMDLPTLVREGEILEVPVYVFNYNNVSVLAEVTIESQSEHLVALDSLEEDAFFSFKQTFSMSIPAQGRVKFSYPIKPLKAGVFNVTLTGISQVGSDAIQKTLTVVPKGVPHQTSKTYLVHFLQDSEQADELEVNIPEDVIRGSETIELSVVGDTFGPLMESLRDLVQVPYGNGKETTWQFISNLLVLKYLKTFNMTNPSLERKAMVYFEKGYQTLLTLKHLDGSFSFFERSLKSTGDALQTAIVMWSLQEAKNFIQVDRNVITRCLNFYLKPKQAPTGGFQSGSGLDDDVVLTSLALLSFMAEEGHSNVISKGLEFLYNNLDDLESPTSIALCKYVLVVGKHEKSHEILSKLSRLSTRIQKSQQLLWERASTLQGILETTSGSFHSMLQSRAKPTETLVPLVTALLSAGNSEKVPTHLMALDAMIGIAKDLHFGARNLNIHFDGDQGDLGNLKVNSNNVHVLQTVELNSATRKVSLQTKGKGFAVVTIKSRFNRPRENLTTSALQTNVTVSDRVKSFVSLKVCVSSQLATTDAAKFTAVEVNLPSGYTVLEDQDENPFNSNVGITQTTIWLRTQAKWTSPKLSAFKVDSKAGSAQAIFKDVDQMGACIQLDALRSIRVLNAKEVSVVAYDVYAEGQKTTTFHELELVEETS